MTVPKGTGPSATDCICDGLARLKVLKNSISVSSRKRSLSWNHLERRTSIFTNGGATKWFRPTVKSFAAGSPSPSTSVALLENERL